MNKIYVYYDERYPDFCIVDEKDGMYAIEVTDEELALIKQADELYRKAQTILARGYRR